MAGGWCEGAAPAMAAAGGLHADAGVIAAATSELLAAATSDVLAAATSAGALFRRSGFRAGSKVRAGCREDGGMLSSREETVNIFKPQRAHFRATGAEPRVPRTSHKSPVSFHFLMTL